MLVTNISPFLTMFSILSKTNINFWNPFILSSANALNSVFWERVKYIALLTKIYLLSKQYSLTTVFRKFYESVTYQSLFFFSFIFFSYRSKYCWLKVEQTPNYQCQFLPRTHYMYFILFSYITPSLNCLNPQSFYWWQVFGTCIRNCRKPSVSFSHYLLFPQYFSEALVARVILVQHDHRKNSLLD